MARSCTGGLYWDRLVRQCMSCQMVCGKPSPHTHCLDFCVAYDCKAVPGQFYDSLLKKCLKCSELCGHHPSECSPQCLTRLVAATAQPSTTRGSAGARGLSYSEVLVYTLLGLAFAVLLSTMLVALLALLRRAREQSEHGEKSGQADGQPQASQDWLMAKTLTPEAGVAPDRPRATETCVYCFTDQVGPPCTLYQQATPQPPRGESQHCHGNGLIRNHGARAAGERDDVLRIICSPTQTSV